MSLFTMFSRSAMYANLTPGERAFLRFLSVLLGGAFLAGVQAVSPMLTTLDPTAVPWASVGHTFLAAFALAVWLGIGKYRSAQGDPPLPVAPPIALTPAAPAASAAAAAAAAPVPSAPPASSLAPVPSAAPPTPAMTPPVAG